MKRELSELPGVKLLENAVFNDARGDLTKINLPNGDVFSTVIYSNNFSRGTVRGLHFQYKPNSEIKIVTCIRGEIIDFLVDVRESSKTFGDWSEVRLSSKSTRSLLVPEGFAHGYQTLEDSTTVLYSISGLYAAEDSVVLNIRDTDIGIDLPLQISEISTRDLEGKSLKFYREKLTVKK